MPAGVAVLGFASDEGVRRNGGRTGAVAGPFALRAVLSNSPVMDDSFLYDAGNVHATMATWKALSCASPSESPTY